MIAEVGTIPYDGFVYSGCLANERGSTSRLQSVQYSTDGEGAKLVVFAPEVQQDSCYRCVRSLGCCADVGVQ
jgi:hypothetical protein